MFEIFKPKGKNNEEVLKSLLEEAEAIVTRFETILSRHSDEIASYRERNPRNMHGKDFDTWIREATVKRLFELSEPEKFNYDFHEFRRSFLEKMDSGYVFNEGEVFIDICRLSGIRSLFKAIISSHQSESLLYKVPADDRSPPNLDVFMFDMHEFDIIILRLYVDASKFYGPDQFLSLLVG